MATAIQIISRALRLCGVLDAAQAADANDAQDALETMNAMLAEWHESDMGLPDYEFATLTAEQDTDIADRDAIAYQLAIRIAPEYGVDLKPLVIAQARDSLFRMRSRYLSVTHPLASVYF